jgi:hypothetical protein
MKLINQSDNEFTEELGLSVFTLKETVDEKKKHSKEMPKEKPVSLYIGGTVWTLPI